MANVGTISAIAEKGDLVVCDKLNHASIIDGVRLSGAMLRTYPHKNLKRLEDILREKTSYKKTFIITDGVFSMDGDIAPLGEIVNIAKKYKAVLMLDDAHGTGVLGKKGKGTCEHLGIGRGIDIHMGTFSKAFGNLGGYIAGSGYLMDYIRNKARSFIYSTAIPPAVAAGCIKAIDIVEKESALRNRLWRNIRKFTGALSGLGFDIMGSETQIVPVYTGSLSATMKTSEFLFKNGVFAPGIRPPTVAKNRCRIRLSLMATHTDEHIEKTIDVFRRLKDERILCNGN
jgi:glycine C-acetyltransferase/8-amino-7-oxononanoate synthase